MASYEIDMSIPSAEELKNQAWDFDKSPLEEWVYICRINKVELTKSPSFVNGFLDFSKLKLDWNAILSPVKQLSGDPLMTVNKTEAKPLSSLLFKSANPFSMGMQPNGAPSNTRALFAFGMGFPADGQINATKIIVVKRASDYSEANEDAYDIANDTESKAYLDEFIKLRKWEIQPDEAKLRNAGFKHVIDITAIEWKYIVASLGVWTNKKGEKINKILSLSKAPTSFNQTEAEGKYSESIARFNDVIYPKMTENKKNRGTASVASAETTGFESVSSTNIDMDDMIPF